MKNARTLDIHDPARTVWCPTSEERPEALAFVCQDDRLRDTARKEGFPVLPS